MLGGARARCGWGVGGGVGLWLWSVECAARVVQVWFIQVQVRYVWFEVPFWGSVHIKQIEQRTQTFRSQESTPKRVTTRCTI
jgi:hypothetical protein